MWDVNIYIHTEYSGSFASGSGKYHVILETMVKDRRGEDIPYTNLDHENAEPVQGMLENITKNRLELTALSEALSRMDKPSRITVYTASEYITNSFQNNWPESWEESGYMRKGKPVKHADLWADIMEKKRSHDITFVKMETTSYTKVQAMALRKIKKKPDAEGDKA